MTTAFQTPPVTPAQVPARRDFAPPPFHQETILSQADFQRIRELVYRHCGINLHSGKTGLVRARLAKLLRNRGLASVSEYLGCVTNDATGREFTDFIDAICTNRTEFFRERSHLDFLRDQVLPTLMLRKAGRRRIRVWSAGCSSGQEPYSLAITLLDALQPPDAWDVKVLATDISRGVLRAAEAGIYEHQDVQAVPAPARGKYFRAVHAADRVVFEVGAALRKVVAFRYLNLMEPWPFAGTFDVIFCRNVMIYFDKPTQQRLVERMWERLDSGGLFFTGHSESLTGLSHRFRYVRPAVYARA